jgi:hypothetical protein
MSDNRRGPDPILDELHAVRRQMHDDCKGNLAELVARMRERLNVSGHPIAPIPVPGKQITKRCTEAGDRA